MIFKNRREAGKLLAKQLIHYAGQAIVLGLPRGGVPVAYEVAHALDVPLGITCPHKIGAPQNPELAIGAVTERGEALLNEDLIKRLRVSEEYLQSAINRETARAIKRLKKYQASAPSVTDQVVILIDDGLATGFTMRAAIQSMKPEHPAKIVVAVPVSPPDTAREMATLCDEFICLHVPPEFISIGQFYEDFGQTTDEEVISLL